MRSIGVVLVDPFIEGRLERFDRCVHPAWSLKNSARTVLWRCSTFPVVVGEYGAVRIWPMSLWAQMRSKTTGPGPGPNRAVNILPLSVGI
jgi:hypothetical protein